jgi:hypothetical protein
MTDADSDSLVRKCVQVRKMLHGLLNKLAGRPSKKIRPSEAPV